MSNNRLPTLLDMHCTIQAVSPMQRHITVNTRLEDFLHHMTHPGINLIGKPYKRDMRPIHRRMVEKLLRVLDSTGVEHTRIRGTLREGTIIDFGMVDVHPECVLFAYNVRTPLLHPFPYIGTSRPPCRGCQYYISAFCRHKDLPRLQMAHRSEKLRHSEVCCPWAAPLIWPDHDDGVSLYSREDESAMEIMMLMYLQRDLYDCLW